MKAKLIHLNDHFYVINNSEINEGDKITSCGDIDDGSLFISTYVKGHLGVGKKIIYSTQQLDGVILLNKSEIEELVFGYSAEKEFKKYLLKRYETMGNSHLYDENEARRCFIDSFQAAMEITKDKLFTFKQVKDLVDSILEFISHHEPEEFDEWYKKKLQKLMPKTQWDIEIDEQGKLTIEPH